MSENQAAEVERLTAALASARKLLDDAAEQLTEISECNGDDMWSQIRKGANLALTICTFLDTRAALEGETMGDIGDAYAPAPTSAPTPGLDLEEAARDSLAAIGVDANAEHVKMLQETVARLGKESQDLRENGDRLAREVYASRHDTEVALVKLAEAKRLGLDACRAYESAMGRFTYAQIAEIVDALGAL